VAILTHQPRHEALGVDQATYAAGFEAVNAAIHAHNRNRMLPDVLAGLTIGHRSLLDVLGRQSEDDLFRKTYARYLPAGADDPDTFPMAAWVIGNTYGHYDEHVPWILALVAAGG